MSSDDTFKINLKQTLEEPHIWIGVVFLNHRIRAKVFLHESFERLTQRLTFILGVEEEYILGLYPYAKKKETQREEKKQPKVKKSSSKDSDMSFSETMEEGQIEVPKEVVCSIKDLVEEDFYLVVYLRPKTEQEVHNEQQRNQAELDAEDGEKSNRYMSSPRKQMIKKFQREGININDCHTKAKRTRGDKRLLICPFVRCQKEFTETGNLKTHLRTHTGERPFVCSFEGCSKQFITKGHLKTHELIHSGDKPFECDRCGKSYSRSGRLKIHMRTHTGEKPFRCNIPGCGKTFTEKGNLKTHLRIHSGEKPFSCRVPGCNKTFTTQGHLTDHMRRHSGDRPFKCEFCGQAFMRSSTLKIHIRRHTGEKPYQCQQCGKRFSESGNLKTHEKTHMNKKKKSLGTIKRKPNYQILKQSNNNLTAAAKAVVGRHPDKKTELKLAPTVESVAKTPYAPSQITKPQVSTLGKRKRASQEITVKAVKPIATAKQVIKEYQEPVQEVTTIKKRSSKMLQKNEQQQERQQIKESQSISAENQEQMIEIEMMAFKREKNSQFGSHNGFSDQNLSERFIQNNPYIQQQALLQGQPGSSTNIQFNPKLLSSSSLQNAVNFVGYPPQIGSPQGFSFGGQSSTNLGQYFPTSLSGYQNQSTLNPANSYITKSNIVPSKQPSFQNLFASLQNNQSNLNQAAVAQIQQQSGNPGLSPTTKGGVQQFFQRQINPSSIDYYGGGSFGGFSPDNQKKFNAQYQSPQAGPQNPPVSKGSSSALEKWKAMGSFGSITSLTDIIMNQKTLQQPNSNFIGYGMQSSSRPMSKQNSSNNLGGFTQNLNKMQGKDGPEQPTDATMFTSLSQYMPGFQEQNMQNQLSKSLSLKNLFDLQQQKANFQRMSNDPESQPIGVYAQQIQQTKNTTASNSSFNQQAQDFNNSNLTNINPNMKVDEDNFSSIVSKLKKHR